MATLETMYPPQANSPATTTTASITSSATSISVLSGDTLPDAPNLLVLGGETEYAETVRMTSKSGNSLTVVRAVEGSARAWPSGTNVARNFTAKDLQDVQSNISALNSSKAETSAVPSASTANPQMDGVASPGNGTTYARGNHVHPKDTSKQDKITASGLLKGNGNGTVSAAGESDLHATGAVTWETDGLNAIEAGSLVKIAEAGGDYPFEAAEPGNDYALPSSVPAPYTSTPEMDGTGSAGSGNTYARGNHRHPSDTNKQNKITAQGLLKSTSAGVVSSAVAGTDYVAPSALSSYLPVTQKGAANGLATLTSDGLLTPAQAFSKPVAVSSSRNITADDYGCTLYTTAATTAARTLTIPAGLLVGAEIEVLRRGSGSVTIQAASSTVTINGVSNGSVTITEQHKSVVLKHLTLNDWNIQGAID